MFSIYFYETNVKVFKDNVHIHKSFIITNDLTKVEILTLLTNAHPDILKYRSFKSMLNEWKAHNILYQHNYQVERTMHVDIDFNQKLRYKIAYWLIAHIFKEKEEK